MKIKFVLFIFVVPLLFSGCASSQQFVHFPDQTKIVEDPGKARIYVMRPGLTGIGISTEIEDEGKSIGSTGPHGFLCWEREPGDTTISATADNTSELTMDVQAGEVKYIVQTLHFGWISTTNRLEIVTENEGKEALTKCKPPISYWTTDTPTNH